MRYKAKLGRSPLTLQRHTEESTMSNQTAQSLIVCALHLSDSYRDKSYLSELTGLSVPHVENLVHELESSGVLHHCVITERWRSMADAEFISEQAALLRLHAQPESFEYLVGALAEGRWLEQAASCLRYLDEHISEGNKRVLHFFEIVLLFFIRLGQELGSSYDVVEVRKYMQSLLFLQILCVSTKKFTDLAAKLARSFYDFNLLMQADGVITHPEFLHSIVNAGFSKGNIFTDLLSRLEDLHLPQPVEGESSELAELNVLPPGYEVFINELTRSNPEGASYLARALCVCISHIAMHLQKYSLSSDLYRSLCSVQAEDHENEVSLTWSSHYCFVLLREGRFADALELLEELIEKARAYKFPIAFSSAARGIALYYFIHNNIEAAHKTLERETQYAIKNGIQHSNFLDPLILDMLYVFDQQGYPPIERYELDSTIHHIMESTNLLLQGAAQRVKAMLMRSRGANPRHVVELLQASQLNLHPERDRREITLILHELANTLSIVGEYERAWQLRKSVAERLGCMLDSTTPYRVTALLATSIGASVPDIAAYAKQRSTARGESTEQPVSAGFKKSLRLLSGMHHSLQQVPASNNLEDVLQHVAATFQFEMQCTWAGLFQPLDSRYSLSASSPVIGKNELFADMALGIEWASRHATGVLDVFFKRNSSEFYLCLDAGEEDPWIMAVFCATQDCVLCEASPIELEMMAKFLSAEVRSLLRLQRFQEEKRTRPKKISQSSALPPGGKELDEVVGEGARALLADLELVAPTDAYVLLNGETGVGKEVTARQIHKLSGRTGEFISVNPASISESLFESEFFGHERGSFTGALGQRKGYIELADQGTLFIDEVGEMPLSVQTKLLRVLQEQAFVRVGGNMPIRSDFRLVSATNKDLIQEVRRGRFRQDLLHRIMVIPIEIPPLRERRSDIGELLDAFIRFFCQRYQKPLLKLSQKQRKIFYQYDWPGNVRELKNTVERMVIQGRFSPEHLIFHSLPSDKPRQPLHSIPLAQPTELYGGFPSLDELEKRYLSHVLEHTDGKVRGDDGAAALLDMKISTLYGKLKKFGISSRS